MSWRTLLIILVLARGGTCFRARHDDDFMFGAKVVPAGHGRARELLGVQKLKLMCKSLEDDGTFRCRHVWGTGASGHVRSVPPVPLPFRSRSP